MPSRWKITWAVVADGAKSLVLVNEGTDAKPAMAVLEKSVLENPPTREQGSDRPGRMPDPSPGQRSAMEVTDWHELAESRFVRECAERLNKAAEDNRFERLILVAPPKVLGALRAELSPAAAGRVVAEIGADLTRHPVSEIERHLAKALAG